MNEVNVDYSATTQKERNLATAFHVAVILMAAATSMFAGVAGCITSFVVFCVTKSAFVKENAKEAFNFNFTMFLLAIIGAVLMFITVGLAIILVWPIIIALIIVWVYCTVKASFESQAGRVYRFPFSWRILK